MDDYFQSIPFTQHRKIATPVRIVIAAIIMIQFFGFFQFPKEVLYPAAVIAALHLLSIGFEKAKMSTVEIGERRCPKCDFPMYSKVIKCEKCNIQIDTDDERNSK